MLLQALRGTRLPAVVVGRNYDRNYLRLCRDAAPPSSSAAALRDIFLTPDTMVVRGEVPSIRTGPAAAPGHRMCR